MAKPRSTGRRVAGGGASGSVLGIGAGGSVSYAAYATDKDIVQALVTFLEDRRVLYNAEYLEVETEVSSSVVDIRKELTEALQQVEPRGPAIIPLSAMRAACRRYLDHPRERVQHFDRLGRGENVPGFFIALGEMRATFGAELKRLDKLYDLRIEVQLRDLLPEDDVPLRS